MNYLVVAASVALFLIAFKFLRVTSHAQSAISETQNARQVFRDPSLDDEIKEARLQKASLSLFKSVFVITALAIVCIVFSAIPIAVASWAGLAAESEVIPLFFSWEVIFATVVAFVLVVIRG